MMNSNPNLSKKFTNFSCKQISMHLMKPNRKACSYAINFFLNQIILQKKKIYFHFSKIKSFSKPEKTNNDWIILNFFFFIKKNKE